MRGSEKIKLCPKCQQSFTAMEILEDPYVVPIGMRFDDKTPELCVYYFNHITPDCRTTFVVPIKGFASLISRSVPNEFLGESVHCSGYCYQIEELSGCKRACSNAPYREFLKYMMEKKSKAVVDI